MSDPITLYDEVICDALTQVKSLDLASDEATATVKNLEILSKCQPTKPEPEPETIPEPTTFWGKFKAGSAKIWDNETTRVTIKAAGAFGGVALVTWTTVYRDHVITKEAQTQANQRNS